MGSQLRQSHSVQRPVKMIKLGNGVKAEGDLIVSGTKGYIYVPAPWWKTEYFEIRYEDPVSLKQDLFLTEKNGVQNKMLSE